MEHDSSRSGYHEPEPGSAGLSATEEDWGDDYPKTFSVSGAKPVTRKVAPVPSASMVACLGTVPRI